MSASANQGSSWLDVAVPIGPASTSGNETTNTVSFNDGSFTFASTPTPGLTAGISNITGGVAALAQGASNAMTGLTSSLSGVVPLLLLGGVVWWLMHRHKG